MSPAATSTATSTLPTPSPLALIESAIALLPQCVVITLLAVDIRGND